MDAEERGRFFGMVETKLENIDKGMKAGFAGVEKRFDALPCKDNTNEIKKHSETLTEHSVYFKGAGFAWKSASKVLIRIGVPVGLLAGACGAIAKLIPN